MNKTISFSFAVILAFILSGCSGGGYDEEAHITKVVGLLVDLKKTTASYTELEEAKVKPYLEKTIIDIDEAIVLLKDFPETDRDPEEYISEISDVVLRAASNTDEAAIRSDVTDDRYILLSRALRFVVERMI